MVYEDIGEYASGMLAAQTNIILTYPINKIVFRQQMNNLTMDAAIGQIKNEGFRYLYRGLPPPLLHKSIAYSIMFGSYHQYLNDINRIWKCKSNYWTQSIAAVLAGFTEATLFCPFERVQVLLQHHKYHEELKNTFHTIRQIHLHNGFTSFYYGYQLMIVRNCLSNVCFFLLRNPLKEFFLNYFYWNNGKKDEMENKSVNSIHLFIANLISGGVLGATISTIFFPLNTVKTRMQMKVNEPPKSIRLTFLEIYKERNRNLILFFRGSQLNFFRSAVGWGLSNAFFELYRCYWKEYFQNE
ncbi:hypothetical protein SNEBB_010685 [Seison nebaliae]|nr:hypothetical protein SNEBB_010685 [Seison nebaliae]